MLPNRRLLFLASTWLLAFLVYQPGLDGPFVFDDVPNITENYHVQLTTLDLGSLKDALFSIKAGPLYRPVSFLTIAMNHYAFGLDPFYFKLVNVFIHLLVGLFVFLLVKATLSVHALARGNVSGPLCNENDQFYIALLAAAFWVLHPFNVTSVLYVVQRMNALAGLFVVIALYVYCLGRKRSLSGKTGLVYYACAFGVFWPFAVLSKENALLLPIYAAAIEFCFFYCAGKNKLDVFFVKTLLAGVVLGLVVFLFGAIWNYSFFQEWAVERDFTIAERLFTEPRVLFLYLNLIFIPDIQSMYLFHDDVVVSTGLFEPISTVLSILAILIFTALSLYLRRVYPLVSFAFLFFLAGHLMESTIVPLELVHEHRNYIPMIGPLVLLAGLCVVLSRRVSLTKVMPLLSILFILVLASATFSRAHQWGDWVTLIHAQANNAERSSRAQYELGLWYFNVIAVNEEKKADDVYREARKRFEMAYSLDKNNLSGLLALIRLHNIMGLPIDEGWLTALLDRLRNTPLGQPDVVHVQNLIQCEYNNWCSVGGVILDPIVSEMLANDTLMGRNRAIVYSEYGVYKYNAGELESSVASLKKALVAYEDEPEIWISALKLAAISDDVQWGSELLVGFKQRFDFSKYQSRIENILGSGSV